MELEALELSNEMLIVLAILGYTVLLFVSIAVLGGS